MRAPRSAPATVYNWTGFYIGGHGGYGWSGTNWTWEYLAPTSNYVPGGGNGQGWIYGAQGGFLYQMGPVVGGVELSTTRVGQSGSRFSIDTNQIPAIRENFTGRVGSAFNAALRLGVAQDNWLFYAKGGYAQAKLDLSIDRPNGTPYTRGNGTAHGYVAGFGVDVGLTGNWVAGVEYTHTHLRMSDQSGVEQAGVAESFYRDSKASIDTITGRLMYRFPVAPAP